MPDPTEVNTNVVIMEYGIFLLVAAFLAHLAQLLTEEHTIIAHHKILNRCAVSLNFLLSPELLMPRFYKHS